MSKMTPNRMKTRIVHKHATELNWKKAVNFTPLQGELIIYDVDETHSYVRMKIGDGIHNVNDLQFIDNIDPVSLNAMLEEVLI